MCELKEFIDKDLVEIVIFLDLARAFETIDRNRSVKKMQNYGINVSYLQKENSYLQLERVSKIKYLGAFIDNELKKAVRSMNRC